MSENRPPHRHPDGADLDATDRGKQPYWMRAHHDWRFWLALCLMLAAIATYVLSENLAFLPHG